MHLVIGKMEKLDIVDEINPEDESDNLAILPIMANISIPIRTKKVTNRIREKMRIDEPLDYLTYQEHLKFEQLCLDFQDFQDQLHADNNAIFPEDFFLR